MIGPLRVLSLFAGIGGFDLGLERTGGFKTVAFCEIEPFAVRVLNKHWPEVPVYGDVRELTATKLASDGIAVDLICGGFPCQDISLAGRGAGIEGERSGLWSEYARLIREIRPRYVIVENVANLLAGPSEQPGGWYGRVLGDLAASGYDVLWDCIPASAVGAPHRRDRVWLVAHANDDRCHARGEGALRHEGNALSTAEPLREPRLRPARATDVADSPRKRQPKARGLRREQQAKRTASGGEALAHADCAGQPFLQGRGAESERSWNGAAFSNRSSSGGRDHWSIEPDVGRVAHGIPKRVDRLRCLGNAVVPVIPELIGNALLAAIAMRCWHEDAKRLSPEGVAARAVGIAPITPSHQTTP